MALKCPLSDGGFVGLAVLSYNRFVIYLDYDYLSLSADAKTKNGVIVPIGTKVKGEVEMTMGTYGAGYRFGWTFPRARIKSRCSTAAATPGCARETRTGHLLPHRFITQGFGDTKPIADNKTEEGRAQNRRASIHRTDCGPR